MRAKLVLSLLVNLFLLEIAYGQTPITHPDRTFTALRVFHVLGQAFDYSTTVKTVDLTKGFHETNPLLGQNPVQQALVMGSMAYGIDHAAHVLYPDHPRLSKLVLVVGGSAHFTFGAINIERLRR